MLRCRKSSTIPRLMLKRQIRDRSLSLFPSTSSAASAFTSPCGAYSGAFPRFPAKEGKRGRRRYACLSPWRRKLVRYGSILSGNFPVRYGTPGGMRTSGHPSLRSSMRPAVITSSSIRASSGPVKMPLPAYAPVNCLITCVRHGRKHGVFLSSRKAARSTFGPRPSKAWSSPHAKKEQARQWLCDGGPAQVKHSALARLLHEFDNTIDEFRVVPSGFGDGIVRFHRQPLLLDSTCYLGSGLCLELPCFLGTVRVLHPRLPLRTNLLDLDHCGRKGRELVLTGFKLLGWGL